MKNMWLVPLTGLVSGAWAASLTVVFFGFIPTLPVVFMSGFLSGALGLATVLCLEKLARKR
jgi:hypothetical protein